MKTGDLVFFYHSNAKPAAIVGIAEVAREAYPDASAFDAKDSHYDPKSKRDEPTWFMVDIAPSNRCRAPSRSTRSRRPKASQNMALVRLGRLSVQPVTTAEYEIVHEDWRAKTKGLTRSRQPFCD